MRRHYHQVTLAERHLLGRWLREGIGLAEIGRRLGRSTATISREVWRNGSQIQKRYLSTRADERSVKRRKKVVRKKRMGEEEIWKYVTTKLWEGWSPELIAGRIAVFHPGRTISHETIYRWVYREGREYRKYLVRQHTRRKKKGNRQMSRAFNIPQRVGIEERPETVARREEAGHWEVDTAFFHRCREVMLVMAERKTRYTLLAKMKDATALELRTMMFKRQQYISQHLRKSFTYDNGRENVSHVYVNSCFGSRSYFCHPGRSWEKGTVENTIGILRRRLPKAAPFATLSEGELKAIERWLNNRPRKCLNFRTPKEAYLSERCT